MKRNLNSLIAQVKVGQGLNARGKLTLTSNNIHQYTNKILVEANQYNQLSQTQKIINKQMKGYNEAKIEQFKILQKDIKQKAMKPISLENQIIHLQMNFNLLLMEDVMAAIRMARKDELFFVRNKLIKLQSSLSFKLEQEDIAPHMEQPLQSFLKELNEVINKKNMLF